MGCMGRDAQDSCACCGMTLPVLPVRKHLRCYAPRNMAVAWLKVCVKPCFASRVSCAAIPGVPACGHSCYDGWLGPLGRVPSARPAARVSSRSSESSSQQQSSWHSRYHAGRTGCSAVSWRRCWCWGWGWGCCRRYVSAAAAGTFEAYNAADGACPSRACPDSSRALRGHHRGAERCCSQPELPQLQ